MPATSKAKTTFLCSDCGYSSPKWAGRCPSCGAWGTLAEFREPASPAGRTSGPWLPANGASAPALLNDQPDSEGERLVLGMPEVDRLLGGGVVPGSMLLMAGDPGVGKSTLLLEAAANAARTGQRVLYVSGEESGAQVRMRAQRLGVLDAGVLFLAETSSEAVLAQLDSVRPGLAIVDSIQTLSSDSVQSTAGSIAQVRECTQALLAWAKARNVPVLLAGHVTKDGNVAGPRLLEHMVDVVLYMEGEQVSAFRVLRCTKNRFGSTNEVALLEMRGDGLAEVADPSAALIGERRAGVPGSAVVVTLEGTRPVLLEVQALTSASAFTPPRRTANGIDLNRVVMLTAVLGRRAAFPLSNQDVMTNVPGGLRISEPAADLGLALAIASSFRDQPLDPATVFIGEVGLNGEVRRVPQTERRLWEAARHGFTTAFLPERSIQTLSKGPEMEVVGVRDLRTSVQEALLH